MIPSESITIRRREAFSAAAETSVIVPAFNEGLAIRQVIAALQSAAPWREIIVVDDGSSDATAARGVVSGKK